jgi:hypothetical protein
VVLAAVSVKRSKAKEVEKVERLIFAPPRLLSFRKVTELFIFYVRVFMR